MICHHEEAATTLKASLTVSEIDPRQWPCLPWRQWDDDKIPGCILNEFYGSVGINAHFSDGELPIGSIDFRVGICMRY